MTWPAACVRLAGIALTAYLVHKGWIFIPVLLMLAIFSWNITTSKEGESTDKNNNNNQNQNHNKGK